jgi:hypothetical protein
MAEDDFGEDGLQIAELASERGGRHAQGDGEIGEAEAGAAVTGKQVLGGAEDAILGFEIPGGASGALAGQVVDLRAEDALGYVHGVGNLGN